MLLLDIQSVAALDGITLVLSTTISEMKKSARRIHNII